MEIVKGFEKETGTWYAYCYFRHTELAYASSRVSQETAIELLANRLAEKLASVYEAVTATKPESV